MKALLLTTCLLLTIFIGCTGNNMNHHFSDTVVILLGPPGSGKGTQAKKISKELQIPHISTGDLFRENLANGTALGNKVKTYMESGNLVPDQIVIDMLVNRVAADDCKNGYLLDGFPRSIAQAEALDKVLENKKIIAINLNVSDDLLIKRIVGRTSCKNCGAIFNDHFNPPKKENICDVCDGELIRRSDDNIDVVRERLKVYHSQTAPLEKFYADKGVLRNINGDRDPEVIFHDIIKSL